MNVYTHFDCISTSCNNFFNRSISDCLLQLLSVVSSLNFPFVAFVTMHVSCKTYGKNV